MKPTKSGIVAMSILSLLIFANFVFSASAVRAATAQAEKGSIPSSIKNPLDEHFHKAEDDFKNKDNAGAASQVQQAASLVDLEAKTTEEKTNKSILEARKDLEDLSGKLKNGTVKSEGEMRTVFVRVHQLLAKAYSEQASSSWTKKAVSQLSRDMTLAADNLESAWNWTGREIEKETQTIIVSAKEIAHKLKNESDANLGEAKKSIGSLNKEISKVKAAPEKELKGPLTVKSSKPPETTGSRDVLTTAITKVAESTIPAVVSIFVTERMNVPNPFVPYEHNPFFKHFFHLPKKMPKKFKEKLEGLGSGMIVDTDGHILTNNHVVAGATVIKVILSTGDEYNAKVVGTDPPTDLAVVKISPKKILPFVTFGDSNKVKVGQWVVAIGRPRGLTESVTQGIISAKHRVGIENPTSYQDFLQTDAPINPGNSGGPLLTLDGKVIGVNSAIATESGGFEGLGFAIPSSMAVHVGNALIKYGKVERGWLGASIQPLTPSLAKSFGLSSPHGALIAQVMKQSPADKAGLKRGDIVLKYGEKKVRTGDNLRNDVADTKAGTEVKLTVWRDDKEKVLTVKIGNLEELKERLT
ncbi:MAG: trypsin-like peptidase domain-containing protein, partial [Deltaproteobacteria bacterium]